MDSEDAIPRYSGWLAIAAASPNTRAPPIDAHPRSGRNLLRFPTGALLIFAFLFGVVYFFADFSYISAFTAAGGSVMTVTTILMMTPVFSSLVKYFYTGGGLPNGYQIAGYVLAVAAVYVVGKGNTP
ncbi:MAG: hypothetical protein A3A44_00450 [Candidatus Sungbacteria bacterium RIFCSPLOWO2_01_FULL_60_25]|uniref:Uncharacterized protein n=1 Tax=Candidatus Sungbacteria bacterium RIFCSPLOWO2_01_FULL_60_25 TaxID=1802281 RepID=A0A1G2LBS3_9BACT|nr:MAG: hypothetical protein A3A44_00450 [Candidatus Sungbacteria bacterium RIFCSPLOWO2_01_FULL_60_25]